MYNILTIKIIDRQYLSSKDIIYQILLILVIIKDYKILVKLNIIKSLT